MEKREQRVQKIIELRKEKVEKQKRNIWGMVLITVIVLLMIFIMLYQKKEIVDTMSAMKHCRSLLKKKRSMQKRLKKKKNTCNLMSILHRWQGRSLDW